MGVITPIVWRSRGLPPIRRLRPIWLRRWCGGLTLSSPEPVPGLEAFWLFVGALGVLLVIGLALQGFGPLFRQLVDVPGHARLARAAAARVWGAGRLVVASIGFTVLSWTGGQTLAFYFESPERGRGDLQLLFRIRSRSELAFEQGLTAALTPLRDLAGLADNLPALVAAIWLLFRFSSSSRPIFVIDSEAPPGTAPTRFSVRDRSPVDLWSTVVWTCAGLYAIYRVVARAAGSPDLPVGNCLVVEALIVPVLMLLCDGFLLAWVLVELRDAGQDVRGEVRLDPAEALKLMPAAAIGCLLALPSRYAATAVFLGSQHVPASVLATPVGRYIRWQLGWGLVELQAASLVVVGVVGVAAWSQGTTAETLHGFRRLLAQSDRAADRRAGDRRGGVRDGGRRGVFRRLPAAAGRLGAGGGRQLRPLCDDARRPLDARRPGHARRGARCRSPRRLPSPARGRDRGAAFAHPFGNGGEDGRIGTARPRFGRKSETVISQHRVASRKLYIDALRVEPRSRGFGRLQGVWFA